MIRPMVSKLSNAILDEATRWFVEFSEGDLTHLQRQNFIAWLRASPEHVRAYLQITAHWEEARSLERTQCDGIDALIALARTDTADVVPLLPQETDPHHSSDQDRPRVPPQRKNRKVQRWLALAASFVAVSAGIGYWIELERNTYTTDTGEQRSLTLADGSTVELNAQSKIRVRFQRHERDITLISGQALFHVAKDPNRPFVVHTDSIQVRAVGTQFDVYRRKEGTTVTVLEGTVAVVPTSTTGDDTSAIWNPSPPPPTLQEHTAKGSSAIRDLVASRSPGEMFLSVGDQAIVSAKGAVAPQHLADTSQVTAWTHKQIVLRNTALIDVVAEFNRYNTRPIVIIDPSVESIHISGIFSSSNPQSLLRGLESLGKFTIRETPDRVEISAK
jgi:transmembrane sensor